MVSKEGEIRRQGEKSEAQARVRIVELPNTISVRQLAEHLGLGTIDVLKRLMRRGVMANINQVVQYDVASQVVQGLGYEPRLLKPKVATGVTTVVGEIKKRQSLQTEELANLKSRPPVVTIMGHVDHGKTSLLDAIRQTNVVAGEAGGITQRIGAYQVEINGQKITFLDTPGHEAFTAMRARGAQATDVAVLVVAADDGIMPQTLEAIGHARAARVPIMVAINKVDKPGANPELVKQQLAEAGLAPEDWGGDTVCVLTSAKQRTGIKELLENLLVVAEMENLRANPNQSAVGVVIEAGMDKTRGPVATVLIHDGTLKMGDIVVVGTISGRVKAMFSDTGKRLRRAEPATPVAILGLPSVPQVGDALKAVSGEREAQALVAERQKELAQATPRSVTLDRLYTDISSGKVKELNVVLRADVQGSIEPIKNSLEQLSTDEIKVRIIHSGTGIINESDVMLALASRGLVIGFSVATEPGAKRLAEAEGVDIRSYNIIYSLVDDVAKALKGMLEPALTEVIQGRAEVRAVFTAGKREKVAGIYVSEGRVSRGDLVRVRLGDKVVSDSTVASLRRFKDDVREVAAGYECGLGVQGFSDFQVGDILEFYRKVREG